MAKTPMLALFVWAAIFQAAHASSPRIEDALPALQEGRWTEAVAVLEQVVAQNPLDGRAHYYLGASLERLGRHRQAVPELEAALELGVNGGRSGMRSAHLTLARSLAGLGDADGAFSHIEAAWAHWGFDGLADILNDEGFALLHSDPRMLDLAGRRPEADAGDRDARWLADLTYLRHLLEEAHPNPFHTISPTEWSEAADRLAEQIPTSGDLALTAAMMRLLASIEDGHTALYPPTEGELAWHLLPFFPVRMSDGWFVAAATPEYADIVGSEIVGAAGKDWAEIVSFASAHLASDNRFTHRWLAAIALQFAEIYALASGSPEVTPVTFQLQLPDGSRVSRTLDPGPADRDPNAHWAPVEWPQAFDRAPLWLDDPSEMFSFQTLPGTDLLYVRLLQTVDAEGRTLADAGHQVRLAFHETGARGLILDLRLDNGGDANEARGFVDELIRLEELGEPGRLAVLIGPRTYSATGYVLGMLQKHLEPMFVGWPSGCRPVAYSSERAFRLPYTGLTGSISSELRIEGNGTDDLRPAFMPDVLVWPTGDDLRQGRDPVLEAAIASFE